MSINARTLLLSRWWWCVSTPLVLIAQTLSYPDALSERAAALYARAPNGHQYTHQHCHSETAVPKQPCAVFLFSVKLNYLYNYYKPLSSYWMTSQLCCDFAHKEDGHCLKVFRIIHTLYRIMTFIDFFFFKLLQYRSVRLSTPFFFLIIF